MVYGKQHGFTMLELMIVLAIISILALVAVPNYKLYIEKAKFSQLPQAAVPYKTAVNICAHLLGGLTESSGANCGTPGHNGIPQNYTGNKAQGYVASIVTSYQAPDVLITIASQRLSAPYNYILRGQLNSQNEIEWRLDPQSSCLAAGLCHEG